MNDAISGDDDGEWPKSMAAHVLDPQFMAAAVTESFALREFGPLDLDSLMDLLASAAQRVRRGDFTDIEAMLLTQAHALQSIFTTLAIHASRAPNGYKQVEIYLRLALKSQNQSRATLEALTAMKNPRQVAFVAQANIAQGPQQVNNFPAQAAGGVPPVANAPNELLEQKHGKRVDAGAPSPAGGVDPGLAAVDAVNGTSDGRREGPVLPQCR